MLLMAMAEERTCRSLLSTRRVANRTGLSHRAKIGAGLSCSQSRSFSNMQDPPLCHCQETGSQCRGAHFRGSRRLGWPWAALRPCSGRLKSALLVGSPRLGAVSSHTQASTVPSQASRDSITPKNTPTAPPRPHHTGVTALPGWGLRSPRQD